MSELQLDALTKLFPSGCVIIHRNSCDKNDGDIEIVKLEAKDMDQENAEGLNDVYEGVKALVNHLFNR